MQISFVVTAKLIWVFVLAYAKSRFSHHAAHICSSYLITPYEIKVLAHKIVFCCFMIVFYGLFQQWSEAAVLYEQGGFYDKAASVYIRGKNW